MSWEEFKRLAKITEDEKKVIIEIGKFKFFANDL